MSKIILTKKQAEFIEGFKSLQYDNNEVEISEELPLWASYALHSLMEYGFGEELEDANGKEASNDFCDKEDDFNHDQVPLLIEAIMHGYEVEGKKVVLYIWFHDSGREEDRKVYFGANINVTNKEIATEYDLSIEREAKKVEELKAKGWEVEEVE